TDESASPYGSATCAAHVKREKIIDAGACHVIAGARDSASYQPTVYCGEYRYPGAPARRCSNRKTGSGASPIFSTRWRPRAPVAKPVSTKQFPSRTGKSVTAAVPRGMNERENGSREVPH